MVKGNIGGLFGSISLNINYLTLIKRHILWVSPNQKCIKSIQLWLQVLKEWLFSPSWVRNYLTIINNRGRNYWNVLHILICPILTVRIYSHLIILYCCLLYVRCFFTITYWGCLC